MSYQALYRKWRPQGFEDVKGQEHIVTTLKIKYVSDASDMPICSAAPGEREKQRWQRSLPKR